MPQQSYENGGSYLCCRGMPSGPCSSSDSGGSPWQHHEALMPSAGDLGSHGPSRPSGFEVPLLPSAPTHAWMWWCARSDPPSPRIAGTAPAQQHEGRTGPADATRHQPHRPQQLCLLDGQVGIPHHQQDLQHHELLRLPPPPQQQQQQQAPTPCCEGDQAHDAQQLGAAAGTEDGDGRSSTGSRNPRAAERGVPVMCNTWRYGGPQQRGPRRSLPERALRPFDLAASAAPRSLAAPTIPQLGAADAASTHPSAAPASTIPAPMTAVTTALQQLTNAQQGQIAPAAVDADRRVWMHPGRLRASGAARRSCVGWPEARPCSGGWARPGRPRGLQLVWLLLLGAALQAVQLLPPVPAPAAGAVLWSRHWYTPARSQRPPAATAAANEAGGGNAGAAVAAASAHNSAIASVYITTGPDGELSIEPPHVWQVNSGAAGRSSAGGDGGGDRVSGHVGGAVQFSGGHIAVDFNVAATNLTALLAWDPTVLPPPLPPPSPPPPQPPPQPLRRRLPPVPPRLRKPRKYSGTTTDAQLALRELLTSKRLPYDPTKPYKLPAASYEHGDFVFATGSFPKRYLLAQATRSWRQGIRAFIAVNTSEHVDTLNRLNQEHNERYEYFPDDGQGDLGPKFHGLMRGDSRAAMAPFLAHRHFGDTYKWMLYGDDDTVFYMPAVKRMLAHLDPDLPLAISDNLWYRARHPNMLAPRCLPCHLAVDADPPSPFEPALHLPNMTEAMDGYLRFLLGVRTAADTHTPEFQRLLTKRTFTDYNKSLSRLDHLPPSTPVPGLRYLPRPACPFCTMEAACHPPPPDPTLELPDTDCAPAGGHGGAGMIFSVGLLRRLSFARMRQCLDNVYGAPGGDSILSYCLWQNGYAFTDPGPSVLSLYDGNHVLFSSEAGKWALHDPLSVFLRSKCDSRCKWLLRNAVSHHGRGRHFQNFEQSAAYLFSNVASHSATAKWLGWLAVRDGDLAELESLTAGDGEGGGSGEGGGGGAAATAAAASDPAGADAGAVGNEEEADKGRAGSTVMDAMLQMAARAVGNFGKGAVRRSGRAVATTAVAGGAVTAARGAAGLSRGAEGVSGRSSFGRAVSRVWARGLSWELEEVGPGDGEALEEELEEASAVQWWDRVGAALGVGPWEEEEQEEEA